MATHSLGARLKAERESRGLTLVQISDSTKLPVALLAGLERDDLSRWPSAFYGRAFFRSYVTALGLEPEPFVLEFVRLIPDDSASPGGPDETSTGEQEAVAAQPLALSWAGPSRAYRMTRSVGLALLELLAIATVGAVIAWSRDVGWLEGIGVAALVYVPAARAAAQRSRRWQPTQHRTAGLASHRETAVPLQIFTSFAHLSRVASSAAQRAGLFANASLMRGGRIAARAILMAARGARRAASRAYAIGSYAFWRAVRSVAEHAESLASRQLNQTRD